jgi:hypothetical protein
MSSVDANFEAVASTGASGGVLSGDFIGWIF